jgi:hypothetical protein
MLDEKFQTAVNHWMQVVQSWINTNYAANYSHLTPPVITMSVGCRYVKIVREDTGRSTSKSVFAFIDKTNGDILKPSSWAAPAKHARGNLFDTMGGLGQVDADGVHYLR